MEDGDAKAWEHAIATGAMDPLSDDDKRQLALMLCYTVEQRDGGKGTSEAEIRRLWSWARETRTANGLLENVLDGSMYVRMEGDEPEFGLTPKGDTAAKAIARDAGLPVPDDK